MRYNLKDEVPALIVAILPLLYLLLIWNTLPDIIPIHWNIHGEIDQYGKKATLLWIPFLLPILTYIIFIIAPLIDPKRKLQNMGDKLKKLKFASTFLMSVLAVFIIHSTKQQELNPNFLLLLMGTLFAVLGNFFPTIKPNYFIGIRIPWTLNNENNWKQTHQFAGKFWIIGGVLIVLYGLFLNPEMANLFFLVITILIVLIPVIYSYRLYLKENKKP